MVLKKKSDSSYEWFEKADGDLGAAQLLFQNKKYSHAIFFLQQANEKIFKGLCARLGFMGDSQKTDLKFLGLQIPKPTEYGHAGYRKLVDFLGTFTKWFEGGSEFISKSGLPDDFVFPVLTFKEKNIPDFRNRVRKAKESIKKADTEEAANYLNPPTEQLDAIIKDFNKILDQLPEQERKFIDEANKIRLPNKIQTVKLVEKQFGVKLDKKVKANISRMWDVKGFVAGVVTSVTTLIILTIISLYLAPHEKISRYPDVSKGVVYGENLSLVKKFDEVAGLLKKCLDIAKGEPRVE